jgi:hypothetical protein
MHTILNVILLEAHILGVSVTSTLKHLMLIAMS